MSMGNCVDLALHCDFRPILSKALNKLLVSWPKSFLWLHLSICWWQSVYANLCFIHPAAFCHLSWGWLTYSSGWWPEFSNQSYFPSTEILGRVGSLLLKTVVFSSSSPGLFVIGHATSRSLLQRASSLSLEFKKQNKTGTTECVLVHKGVHPVYFSNKLKKAKPKNMISCCPQFLPSDSSVLLPFHHHPD